MIFNPPFALVAALSFFVSGLFAQVPQEKFHWDHRKSEGLFERDSVGRSKALSGTERALLIEAMASRLRPFASEMEIESEEKLQEAAAKTRVKAVDLGDDGSREFLLQNIDEYSCSPTGNCDFWVFRLYNGKYSLLLHRSATQSFTIQPTKTNGFHDLVLGQHGSATDQGLTWYRFDGSKYRRVACYDANFRSLGKDGVYHDRKRPILTPEICGVR